MPWQCMFALSMLMLRSLCLEVQYLGLQETHKNVSPIYLQLSMSVNTNISMSKTALTGTVVVLYWVRSGQVRLGQVRFGQVWLGLVRFGQVRLDCMTTKSIINRAEHLSKFHSAQGTTEKVTSFIKLSKASPYNLTFFLVI